MVFLWKHLLLFPLLNTLILLYETVAFGNLGLAVIELTVVLRIILFPLTIISERNKAKYERIEEEMERIADAYKDDQVAVKDQVRELLQENRISPWAKTSVLIIQGLVLVAIYQVFIHGINASLDGLYAWVPKPQIPINTLFFGIEVGSRSFWWAFATGAVLYVTIVIDQRKHANLLGKSDAVFRYGFPIFTVAILWLLPMVKSLFVLTSILFSEFISIIRHRIWPTD